MFIVREVKELLQRNGALPPLPITGIGSLPPMEMKAALDQVFTLNIPYLPTFPKLSSREGFLAQLGISEGPEILSPWPPIALNAWSQKVASQKTSVVKLQWPGPLALFQALKTKGRVGEFSDYLLRWKNNLHQLVQAISRVPGQQWVFFDEPGLAQSMGKVKLENKAWEALMEATAMVDAKGVAIGLHCCGEIPWEQIINLPVRQLSFDWALSSKNMVNFQTEIKKWFDMDRSMVLGLVPTRLTQDWEENSVVSEVQEVFFTIFGTKLAKAMLGRCWLSPACGLGMRSVEEVSDIFDALLNIQGHLQRSLHQK